MASQPVPLPLALEQELAAAGDPLPSAVTLGVFDGLHLGHRHLIERLQSAARSAGLRTVIVTFYPHPLKIVSPTRTVLSVLPWEERLARLRETGVDCVIPVTFTRQVASLPPDRFVDALLDHLEMRALIVGPDFAMGHGRAGNAAYLRRLGVQRGFSIEAIQPFVLPEGEARSSVIRAALTEGAVERAACLLGRPFAVSSLVVHGDERGRLLGFPTANLAVPADLALPAAGVYACQASVGDHHFAAATNIGVRPTFGGTYQTLETHLLGFTGNLYGQRLHLTFLHRLRGEQRFGSLEELRSQIEQDVERTRALVEQGSAVGV